MNLFEYEMSSELEKTQWMNSFKITSGLRYFGGKSTIGKYLVNRILNMAVKMKQDGQRADIFVDMFAGGGKIALSMPEGFFDAIVMNDLNYGICSFFECCKEKPEALIRMIEELGAVMSKEVFLFCAYNRNNDRDTNRKVEADRLIEEYNLIQKENNIDELKKEAKELIKCKGITDEEIKILQFDGLTKEEKLSIKNINLNEKEKTTIIHAQKVKDAEHILKVYNLLNDNKVEPLVSAAMTYWVTQTSFNGVTDPKKVSYRLGMRDNKSGLPTRGNEKEDIEKVIIHARKHIKLVHDKMHRLNIIVEHLDYRELIKKYNGMPYKTVYNEEGQDENYKRYNKLWYGDSPYHPATLNGAEAAPYEDTFSLDMAREMINILHGDNKDIYGEIEYFIKSDYSPKYTCKQFGWQVQEAERKLAEEEKKGKRKERITSYKNYIARMKRQLAFSEACYKDFDKLEDNLAWEGHEANTTNPEFYVMDLGEFDKGAVNAEDGSKLKGKEFIWCRGNYIPE
nr:hypothetical protein [uncultured Eisenbergiella sp.]